LAYRFSVLLEGQMIGLVDINGIAGDSGILGYWLEKAYGGEDTLPKRRLLLCGSRSKQ
jgi:RimJ/RimL family protein N-acetyltransferase